MTFKFIIYFTIILPIQNMVYVNTAQYLYAVLGGLLLGISTTINYALRGKVTGMSGTFFSIISFNKKDLSEKLTLVGGMFLISGIFFDIFGYQTNPMSPFGQKSGIASGLTYFGFVISGFLVGFGTKLSNGCTSGHGLCGMPRLSIRSFVAVGIFLMTAIGVSTLLYYTDIKFIQGEKFSPNVNINNTITAQIFLSIGILLPILSYIIQKEQLKKKNEALNFEDYIKTQIIIYSVGIIFGLGLMISGMTRREKIRAFLQMNQNWDPSLLFVLMSGVCVNFISFNYMIRIKKKSYLGNQLFNPSNKEIDWKLILGAFLFGIGWGMGSLCPGPFLMLFSVFTIQIQVLWGISCVIGMLIANYIGEKKAQKKQKEIEMDKQLMNNSI